MDRARAAHDVPALHPSLRSAQPSPARSGAPAGAGDARSVLRLQRLAGNRAVSALFAAHPASAAPSSRVTPAPPITPFYVQRTFKRWKPKEGEALDAGFNAVDAKAKAIDAAVDAAYLLVVGMLKAKKAVQLPGVSDKRYAAWIETLTNPMLGDNARAASTGYIIEDNATFGFRGDPMVSLQDTSMMAGTRPDATITDQTNFWSGYLDITSAPEAGHVFDKKGHWGLKAYVVESLYPKIDFDDPAKSPLKLSAEDLALVDQWREQRAGRAIVKAQRAYESRKRKFNAERRPIIRDLKLKSDDFRRQVGGAMGPSERSRGPSRMITHYRAAIQKYGIVVSPDDGAITVLKFAQVLRKQGYVFKPERIRKLYGL